MFHLKNIINCIKFVFIFQLTTLTSAQTDSIKSESISTLIDDRFSHNDNQILISADSSIMLSTKSLFEEKDSTINGDFTITFNRLSGHYDNNQILLKNAQASYTIKNNIRILTAIQCTSITSTFREMRSSNSTDYYTFISGLQKMSVPLKKLSVHFENGLLLVKTSQLNIVDNKNKLCQVYANSSDSTTIVLNDLFSCEIKKHFYTINDTLNISTTKTTYSNQVSSIRYNFLATRADFWFDKKNTGNKWMIRLSSCDDTMAGPLIMEDVLDPRYLQEEFTIKHQLEKPVFLTVSDSGSNIYVDWIKTGKRNKLQMPNNGEIVDYCGWKLRLHQCSLTSGGIIFDSLDIKIPYPFSEENDSSTNDNFICGFKGLKVSCLKDNDNLTIDGSATALPSSTMRFTSSRHYMIEKIQKCIFCLSVNNEYLLQIIHNGLLHLPVSENHYFNEKNDVVVKIDTLKFRSDNISRLRAEGTIKKTFGNAGKWKNGTAKPLLALHGKILVRYLANDFNLDVKPQDGKPLFSLPASGLFDNEASIDLPKGSIGFFSDFTINTLYIRGDLNKDKTITPALLGKNVKFKVPGIEVFQTNDGPQLVLNAPNVLLISDKKQPSTPHYYKISQVVLDLNKKIKAINGNVSVGENIPNPFDMLLPESIKKSFDFKVMDFSIGSEQSSVDSLIRLQINGTKTILSFKEPFKSTGLYGVNIYLERLRMASTPAREWYLDNIYGESTNFMRMQYHSIKRSSIKTIKTKKTIADTSDPTIITFYSHKLIVNSDTVANGIIITIPKSELETTGDFPFIPARKFTSSQDIKILVKKESQFPQFIKFDSEVKKCASTNIGNLEFKTTEIWFGTDTLLPSSNTSCSNLFLGFSFKELLKDSVSVYSVDEESQPCVLNIYLDGSWRIANGDITKKVPEFPVLLGQCFSKK